MFNDLSTKIKKMIFARVRYMDLYEVCSVSQEWWALTMATCSITCDKYPSFFDFQVKFCNEMMPKEEGWEDWMFVEFTDDKSIELFDPPDEKMIEFLRQKGICVRKLNYIGDPLILKHLKELFPHLETLTFDPRFDKYDGKAVVLPDGLERLRLIINCTYPVSHLKDAFEHLEHVDSIHISCYKRILFDNITFDRLKKLHLYMAEQSTDDLKSLITGSKQLSIVYLENGLIDKQWLRLFPTNIQKLYLENMRFDKTTLPLFGTSNAIDGRQVMRFLCQDWTKIRLFASINESEDEYCEQIYVCRPQTLEEELYLTMKKSETPKGILDSEELQLKVLNFTEDLDNKCDFDIIVPKTVEHFELSANQFVALNFAAMFEDISTLTTLRINSRLNEKIQFSYFPQASRLVALDISVADDVILGSILRNCQSLKQLSLKWPQDMPFSKLPAELKSSSVKQLMITEPNDSFINILRHFPCLVDLHLKEVNMETLTLVDLTRLTSMEFVRISFKNVNSLDALNLVLNCLHLLAFPHLIMVYSRCKPNKRLSCVMGREKGFFRRYSSSISKNDITKMNIDRLSNCFPEARLLYLKGVSSFHLNVWEEFFEITYDLQEFLTMALVEMQQEL